MPTQRELIGTRIRRFRADKGWTQAELGARLAGPLGKGWAKQQVHQAEQGLRAFEPGELVALAMVLGWPVWRLMAPLPIERLQLVAGGPQIPGVDVRRALWGSMVPPDEAEQFAQLLDEKATEQSIAARQLRDAAAVLRETVYQRTVREEQS